MRESVYAVVERALADRAGEWLPPPRDGAGARFDLAARIAVDTALPAVPAHHANDRIETLRSQLERLQSRVAKLEAVAAAVRNATIRDHNVYGEIPDDDWLAIDRGHVARLFGVMAEVDSWRPWGTVLERRLGDV
jgi:hypothetical protein